MRKTNILVVSLAAAGALAAGRYASADIITNGDFESGNTGFNSSYTHDPSSFAGLNAGAKSGAGYYGVVTDSQFWHPSFTAFKDHTTGTGNMMIVNGTDVPNTTVWSASDIAVTPNDTYRLTFWAASAYPVSPATLRVTASGNSLDQTITLPSTAGLWQQYSFDFVANGTSPLTLGLVDTNLALSGNDFAIDDISLTHVASAVPLPASAWSGGALLAGVALAKLRRRTQQA